MNDSRLVLEEPKCRTLARRPRDDGGAMTNCRDSVRWTGVGWMRVVLDVVLAWNLRTRVCGGEETALGTAKGHVRHLRSLLYEC